ncbi:flavohemoglobin expression-modulating QEGLA motif protein [bacterium]|nr:flavohemoglobin expression-modulating QEGLA motif protein [bacterium]
MSAKKQTLGEERIRQGWREADKKLFAFGKSLEILDRIQWPKGAKTAFRRTLREKNPQIPKVTLDRPDYRDQHEELRRLRKKLTGDHPIPIFLSKVCRSYEDALLMLEGVGTRRFTNASVRLYGSTVEQDDPWARDTVRLAKRFLRAYRRFHEERLVPPDSYCILPTSVVKTISKEVKRVFPDENITVKLSEKIASKASANIKGVKIRKSTCFAPHDVKQLLNHELLVHTLTLINGRSQPYSTFGVSSPYTTTTQEGLATFSEFVTNSIDIGRMARISARVRAIDMALQGADFLDVYKYFRSLKQSVDESYFSAMRIFRGGPGTGGVVFTKDLVYIRGLLQVRSFLLRVLEEEQFSYPRILFSGRMTVGDVGVLAPIFESKELHTPKYLPDWVQDSSTLLTYLLSFSAFKGLGEKQGFS